MFWLQGVPKAVAIAHSGGHPPCGLPFGALIAPSLSNFLHSSVYQSGYQSISLA
jgi:hypothetical protein